MSVIHRLPPELANQIAAGEVVERPASVVKELVENAIDAGATRVGITIEQGGKRLVRIEDDGVGMDAADAELAVERHATSKIRSKDDLDAIETLGFRGEALPSIASVSRFSLRTRQHGEMAGTEVVVEGGAIVAVRAAGTPPGTVIDVADLFFNLPARRKFLKADSAESAQISRLVTQFALGYPDVGFTFTSNGRKVLQCPPAGSARERFFQVFGDRPDLVEVSREVGQFRVFGFVARLTEDGPMRGPQSLFVNRRIVRDRSIQHAIAMAYASATIKERSPEAHLFIEMPPDRLDVNVHPTKAEVRFLELSFVHEVIRRAVGDALGAQRPPDLQFSLAPREPLPGEPAAQSLPHVWNPYDTTRRPSSLEAPFDPARQEPWRAVRAGDQAGVAGPIPLAGPETAAGREASAGDVMRLPDVAEAIASAQQAVVDATRPMVPLGQFRDTYIIAVDAEGILIIDQHVAHERVLYEDISARLMGGTLPQQPLLTPLVLDLTAAQCEALESHRATLETLGVEFEEFGGNSVRLTAMPAMLGINDVAATVLALADDLEGLGRGGRIEDTLKHMAATMACHAAVKANMKLPLEKMQFLMDELRRTAYSSVCPHGRPVVLRLTRREIEKNFQRI